MRYRSTVNRCFHEIAAIYLPTSDAKEESIAYARVTARVLIARECSSNCRHFEYICNATSRQALSKKRRDLYEHIPECPINGKKQSIDRYYSILMVSFNRWSINNHRKAFNQEPTPCVRVERGMVRVKCHAQAGSLRNRVFEMRTATGSELFSLLTYAHTTIFTLLSIFSPLDMSNIKLWETMPS